eukprot:CAMPEP_0174818396 /NCGR_PEP_ID=MMETSP1107-20130205/1063_1 /TAXON_ID=36770 /ORGANISM="Paraphysomonas vestita, Strain GFlagA" /LENGTH=253 /DNA_ID=CAMNT_0016030173 /DNA_START=62 /DNA_END=823 /DNA_ORIENTATION=+
MKYLENQSLENFSNFLRGRDIGGCRLDGRIETFSCKRAGEDKKLSKVLEAKFVEDLNVNPPTRTRSTSLGDLSDVSTRRLLIDLISTLNASFPDYDFSTANPEVFIQRDLKSVLHTVNASLAELTASNPTVLEEMWKLIDEVIQLRNSEIYSYVPDMNEDPFSDGTLWSFNYFFFNKDLKRICFFTCLAKSAFNHQSYSDDEDEDNEDEDNNNNNGNDDSDEEYISNKRSRPNDDGDDDDENIDIRSQDDREG